MKLCKDCKNYGSCKKPYSSNSNYAERCKNFDKKHITNFEKIKKMSIEEMAQFLFVHEFSKCYDCGYYQMHCSGKYFDDICCSMGIKHWLESEAEE